MKLLNKVTYLTSVLLLQACSNNQSDNQATNIQQLLDSNLIELSESATGGLSDESLAAIAQEIGDKRIVALGEQTHGVAEVFAAKVQLIEYLNQFHDYDLIVLESGLFDVKEIWQQAKVGNSIKELAPGNIFYMYANSREVAPLFDLLNTLSDKNDSAVFHGFDSQHTGQISNSRLLLELELRLTEINSELTESSFWPEFKQQMQSILDVSPIHPNTDEQQTFLSRIDELNSTLSVSVDQYWYRIGRGLKAQAERQWQIRDNRSVEMGENIKWLASKYPDKKMIVWAHTGHLQNSQNNAGSVAKAHFGEDYYMLQFTASNGNYLDFIDLSTKSVSTPKTGSLEAMIPTLIDTPYAFLPIEDSFADIDNLSAFIYNYHFTDTSVAWRNLWDGVFYINTISAATYNSN